VAIDFDRWAQTYDGTRAASASVLRPLLAALGPPAGRTLLDIGGGTGNFAGALRDAGFRTLLCDLSPEMTRRAAAKGIVALAADAQRLPFADGSQDCAVSVNVMRHVPDRVAAFREARRVLRDGPLVVKVSTAETQRGDWLREYFPHLLEHQPPYQPEAQLASELRDAGFARVEVSRFVYEDADDGSFQALKRFPDRLLGDEAALNTAVFKRLPERELRAGLAQLRRDRASGVLPAVIARYEGTAREFGDGSIFRAAIA
jgi:demethylmenaquinone methyltransferase/2-methoxy-6-polyprenyl-1,4-benzoquinol methylase